MLRKLGMRDSKAARAAEHFSPEEYKQHFEKVSQERYERTPEEIQQLINQIPIPPLNAETAKACEALERDLTKAEVLEAIREMKDGAPGSDGVRISFVKCADKKTRPSRKPNEGTFRYPSLRVDRVHQGRTSHPSTQKGAAK